MAAAARGREPGAGEHAQGGAGARPADRDGRAGGHGAGADRIGCRTGRVRRRAVVEGRARADARASSRWRSRPREPGSTASSCPRPTRVEAAQVEGLDVVGADTLAEAVGFLRGTWEPPADVATRRRRRAGRRDRRPLGGARSGAGAPRPRGRGGRRPQRADGRLARRRQDHARPAAAHDPARRSRARRRWRRRSSTPSPACSARRGAAPRPPVPRAPPLHVHRRAARRRDRLPASRRGVSLAHHGVLFLDELTEFRRDAVEGLRQPLEDGRVVDHARGRVGGVPGAVHAGGGGEPVPVRVRRGRRGAVRRADPTGSQQYRAKLSGPLLDRIDIRLRVPRLTKHELLGQRPGERSAAVRDAGRGGARPAAAPVRRTRRDVQRAAARAGRAPARARCRPARRTLLVDGRRDARADRARVRPRA